MRTVAPSSNTAPSCAACLARIVLEDAAIELIAGRREHAADAELGGLRDVALAFVEEKAETELAQLVAFEVRLEIEHRVEVVRADLDGRFADLERGVRHRMRSPLEHAHAQRRQFAAKLDGQAQSGQSAAENEYVAAFVHHRHRSLRFQRRQCNAARRRCGVNAAFTSASALPEIAVDDRDQRLRETFRFGFRMCDHSGSS